MATLKDMYKGSEEKNSKTLRHIFILSTGIFFGTCVFLGSIWILQSTRKSNEPVLFTKGPKQIPNTVRNTVNTTEVR